MGKYFVFTTEDGSFMPKGMLMGAINSAGAMQSFICETLASFRGVCVEVYIDDIILHSATMEEHKLHVHAVMQRLKEYA